MYWWVWWLKSRQEIFTAMFKTASNDEDFYWASSILPGCNDLDLVSKSQRYWKGKAEKRIFLSWFSQVLCVCVCVCDSVCVCVCMCACAHMRTCMHAWVHHSMCEYKRFPSELISVHTACVYVCVSALVLPFWWTTEKRNQSPAVLVTVWPCPRKRRCTDGCLHYLWHRYIFCCCCCCCLFFHSLFWGGWGGGIIQRIVFLASPHLLWLFFRLGWGVGGRGWLGQSIRFQGWAVQGFFSSFSPLLLRSFPQSNVISWGCYGEGGSTVPHDITSTCLTHVRFQCGVLTGFLVLFPETRGPDGVEQMRAWEVLPPTSAQSCVMLSGCGWIWVWHNPLRTEKALLFGTPSVTMAGKGLDGTHTMRMRLCLGQSLIRWLCRKQASAIVAESLIRLCGKHVSGFVV